MSSLLFSLNFTIQGTATETGISSDSMEFLSIMPYLSILLVIDYTPTNRDTGRFPLNQKFLKCGNEDELYENVLEKFTENPKNVELPKNELFNRKFPRRNVKWNRHSRYVISQNFAIPREVVLFFENSGTDAPSLVNVNFRNFKSKFLID